MDILSLIPEAASEHGPQLRMILLLVHGFIGVLFLGLFAVFLAALWRGRRPEGAPRSKSKIPYAAEAVIFACELGLFLAVSMPFWQGQVDAAPKPGDDPLVVRVVAQQFLWNVHYPGADGQFGRADAALVDEQLNPLGLDKEDPAALDDVVLQNQLHLPLGRPVVVRLTSKDMVHSFAIPEMWVKRDAIPGMVTQVYFTPTETTATLQERTGQPGRTFEIVCSQLCGLGHYQMRGFVTVEAPEAFSAWLADKAPAVGGGDDFWN
ncbi:MAG: cytochrome-c oxidase [Candidatus Hydrogenedens sp.]|nr:cytochrome-c oxidase [Candidatus Hydrogenedens sp.]